MIFLEDLAPPDLHPEGAQRLGQHVRRPLQQRLHVRRDRVPASERPVEVLPPPPSIPLSPIVWVQGGHHQIFFRTTVLLGCRRSCPPG